MFVADVFKGFEPFVKFVNVELNFPMLKVENVVFSIQKCARSYGTKDTMSHTWPRESNTDIVRYRLQSHVIVHLIMPNGTTKRNST